MIGKKLGGRYEILERIGGGGMALVYKGQDLLLHRKVAVKVLRQQYVHDEDFIRRFRREAQSAASLSHPNVVSIYDVGQEGDIHYIVMEHIEGTTLNDLIKLKAPLQVEEAVHYASQIADALDHAHHNEIIHRDIKPHNILIGKNGRVKVTDFGIARAATSSTITQTGSVMGSVHYFSPEHAKGTNAGAKSDLYSLGIVMYQMLTARLPFVGESPISVALKHLQEDVEEPRKVNPLIPQSVENVILKAMRKKADERYQSAKQMLDDLETCLLPERRNESKVTFWEPEGMDEERTIVMPAIRADQFGSHYEEESESPVVSKAAEVEPVKKNGWVKPVIWIVILLILLAFMWYLVGFVKGKITTEEVFVPNVTTMTLEKAEAELKAVNLESSVVRERNEQPKDIVFRQEPLEMNVNVGSIITLYVSDGPEKPKLESYIGQTLNETKAKLVALGVKDTQIVVNEEFSDEPLGTILEQTPTEGEEFDPATVTITFKVSKGQEKIAMPDLVGLTEAEAKKKIADSKLKLAAEGIKREKSYKQPKGKVIKQFPYEPGSEVSPGAEISSLIISDGLPAEAGPILVSVPVSPAEEGKSSSYSIIVSDAQYDNYEYSTNSINKTTSIGVNIIVSPDSKAVVLVKVDGKLVNTITRTYEDYLFEQNGGPTETPTPSESVSPSPTPVSSPASTETEMPSADAFKGQYAIGSQHSSVITDAVAVNHINGNFHQLGIGGRL
ncbi:Stk1 family PASTA domain-containing Ser/Thr kinase [Paenibacillus eucommiae]|uniref:non-specific serine/threonine protein kinase n=1 Tax=Paenibacillus eucommiae TaxID=1355755 RepID=A0ABS4IV09_9BACL|nr:Stk1 family PASTA domain-containing Ser/Thr kinase [Paenibacillus eucommiae]MBP1991431.1 serine/threonine-protein kinase [Paenibacillus eucommiae]